MFFSTFTIMQLSPQSDLERVHYLKKKPCLLSDLLHCPQTQATTGLLSVSLFAHLVCMADSGKTWSCVSCSDIFRLIKNKK